MSTKCQCFSPAFVYLGISDTMDIQKYILPRIGTGKNPIKIAILISGSGSGMKALLEHQLKKENCAHSTELVISNNFKSQGLKHSKSKGISTIVVELPTQGNSEEKRRLHEQLIESELERHDIEVVILSGYMRILSPYFVEKWMGRLLNIHPSLLPNFPGAHAHQEALDAGVKESGCTVHFVDLGVDTGLIIAQQKVLIFPKDNVKELQNRIKTYEHKIYPMVIDALSEGRIEIISSAEVIIHNP